MWGDVPVDEKRVQDAINERLQADGLNLHYERIWIPFGGGTTWEQKTNLMLSTGEEFELLSVLQDRWPVSQYVGQGAAHAIDEYLDEYGPAIMEGIPDNLWKDVTINGKIYALPAYFAPMTSNIERISIRKDLYEKHGLDIPQTREELIRASEIIHANEPDLKPRAWTKLGHDPSVFLHRGYDTYPFTVKDEMIYIDQKGNVKAWIETEEFKQDSAFWRELYVKGLVHPDLIPGGSDLRHRELNKEAITFEHSIWHPTSIQGNEPEGDYMTILLYPDEVKFNSFGMRNGTLVPITAKHPEAAIQFVNWAYSSQENHDLLALGIEGVHWRESDTVLTWNNPYAAGSKTSWESPAVEKIVDPENQPGSVQPLGIPDRPVALDAHQSAVPSIPIGRTRPRIYRRRGQHYHRLRVRFVTGSNRIRQPQGDDRGKRVADAIRYRGIRRSLRPSFEKHEGRRARSSDRGVSETVQRLSGVQLRTERKFSVKPACPWAGFMRFPDPR